MSLPRSNSQPPASIDIRQGLRQVEQVPTANAEDVVLNKAPSKDGAAPGPTAPPKVNSAAPQELSIEVTIGNQRYWLPHDCHLAQTDIDGLLGSEALSSPEQVSKGNQIIRKMQKLRPSKAEQSKSKRKCHKPMDWWIPGLGKIDKIFTGKVSRYMQGAGTEAFLHSHR